MIIKNIYKDESYTLGIFNLSTREQLIKSDFLIDGIYTNLLDNKIHFIENFCISDKFFIIYTISAIDFFVLLRYTVIENFCSKMQNCLIGVIWKLKGIVI